MARNVCAWCELELDERDPLAVRLSSSSPPWTPRAAFGAARDMAALGRAFSNSLRAAIGRPEITLWFHGECWDKFLALLGDGVPS